jgi:chromatin segregation and condensation protein Rec8/ScpA/Scc1 (kleisin family)
MKKEEIDSSKNSIKQDQVHDLLFNREIGWQEIIYDLINTEQLDPWDINITVLTEKYLEKIQVRNPIK